MDKIIIGDEVQNYNKKGEPMLGTRFIATCIEEDYMAGIDFDGGIYVFEPENEKDKIGWFARWRKTGRHFSILEMLHKLRDEEGWV